MLPENFSPTDSLPACIAIQHFLLNMLQPESIIGIDLSWVSTLSPPPPHHVSSGMPWWQHIGVYLSLKPLCFHTRIMSKIARVAPVNVSPFEGNFLFAKDTEQAKREFV